MSPGMPLEELSNHLCVTAISLRNALHSGGPEGLLQMAPCVLWAQQRLAHVMLVFKRNQQHPTAGEGPVAGLTLALVLLHELLRLCCGVLECCLNSCCRCDLPLKKREQRSRMKTCSPSLLHLPGPLPITCCSALHQETACVCNSAFMDFP